MSIADVLSRVSALQQLSGQAAVPATPATSFAETLAAVDPTTTPGAAGQLTEAAGLATAPSPTDMAPPAWLAALLGSVVPPSDTAPTAADAGARTLAAAESQVGVSEQPPGSNDGPQLGVYRASVAGAEPGEPWCAYFASWAAAQGGQPLGDHGQGLGSVAQITDWAQSTGRLLPASATPSPGDLILFGDRHVGVVESVNPDGSLTTVEGNYAAAVSRVTRSPSEATGYVHL